MHKKFLFLIVIVLGIVVVVAGCGGGRDLSTPSSRLCQALPVLFI